MLNKNIFGAIFLGLVWANTIQAQCPACTISLPSGIPADTIYLDSFPDAQKGVYYEQQASFRLPYTTTPLPDTAPDGTVVPNGITLQSFTITGVSGLPLGLNWIGDRSMPMVYNETSPQTRDGCIMVCGTPQQAGVFTINVSILIATGILAPQTSSIPIRFVVHPDTGAGFSLSPSLGCAPLTVSFTNNVQPVGAETITYSWDFGNGTTSNSANPMPVTYADSGTYQVDYQAVSTLAIPRTLLSGVTVTGVGCSDPSFPPFSIGVVDLFVQVSSPTSGTDTTTAFQQDVAPPVSFPFGSNIELTPNTVYSIWVQDDDAITSGFPGPEDCGTVTFSSDTTAMSFNLTSGGLTVHVQLRHDTLYVRDTTHTTDLVAVADCSGLHPVRKENIGLNVFPNPTKDNLTISFEVAQLAADMQLVLFDAIGQELHHEVLSTFVGQYNKTLDMSQFGAGLYLLQVRKGNQIWTQKIVVQE